MIFLVQFRLKQQSYVFQRPQIALALGARAIWLVCEKFACADLSQIVLEIMQLPIHIGIASVYDVILDSWML